MATWPEAMHMVCVCVCVCVCVQVCVCVCARARVYIHDRMCATGVTIETIHFLPGHSKKTIGIPIKNDYEWGR
jgi:hypothetical protein